MAGDGARVEMGAFWGTRIFTPRRRQVREGTEDLEDVKAIKDTPNPPEALPECRDGDTERDIHRSNRSKMPKLASFGRSKLESRERPLGKDEWGEISTERHRGTLGSMGLLKGADCGRRRKGNRDDSNRKPKAAVGTDVCGRSGRK